MLTCTIGILEKGLKLKLDSSDILARMVEPFCARADREDGQSGFAPTFHPSRSQREVHMQASSHKLLKLFPQILGYSRPRTPPPGLEVTTPDPSRRPGVEPPVMRPLSAKHRLACLGLLSLLGTRLEADQIPLHGARAHAVSAQALIPLETQTSPRTLLAAHRGGQGGFVENSLEAFQAAVASGAEQLELDVHLTLDGTLVVMHDPTLERTSTGSGPIRLQTLAALQRLRLKQPDGTEAGVIPTLEDVLSRVPPSVALLIELKVDEQKRAYPGIEQRLAETVRRAASGGRVRVIAFELDSLQRMRDADATIALGQLVPATFYETMPRMQHLAVLQALRIDWLGMAGEGIEPGLAGMLHQADIALAAWTVNDLGMASRLASMVDVLITDDVQGCRTALGRR